MTGSGPGSREDPSKDYRQRYYLPDQFMWHEADWPRIDFDGYMSMVLRLLPPPPARVLDVGCGPGMGAKRLVERGYGVTGVDYNERAVAYGRLLVPEAAFVLGDLRALDGLPGLDGAYDAAICVEVLEHVPPDDLRPVLRGIRARLRPQGVLVLTTPSPRMSVNVWDHRRLHLDEITGLLEESGLKVVRVLFQHRLSPLFSPAVWLLLANRFYDLRVARHALRWLFLRRLNVARTAERAGRFVIRAEAG